MDNIYEELDEAKAEIEKLEVELRAKTDSLMNLKKSHDAQTNQIEEAVLKLERLEQELLQKADEINYAKQINEDLSKDLDKLGADCDEKFKKLEDEKKGLVLALEVANENLKNQDMRLSQEEQFQEVYERSEMEFELFIWNAFVEQLKNDLENSLIMRKDLENSLLAQVDFSESLKQEKHSLVHKLEEKENRIEFLQQHVFLSEQDPNIRDPASYLQIIEEKDKILEEFQREVLRLEQESVRREFESDVIATSYAQGANEFEKENLVNGKNKTDELMQQVISLEQKFNSSLTSFSAKLAEKQAEINQVQEACDMITAIEVLASLEIEEKKLMIEELEEDINELGQKLKFQEEKWSKSEQVAMKIEAEMVAKKLRIKDLTHQIENKLSSDSLHQKLKIENGSLLENGTGLSSEQENLCTSEEIDTQVLDMLRSIVHSFENDCLGMNFKRGNEILVKENMIKSFSDIRSPFKEINN